MLAHDQSVGLSKTSLWCFLWATLAAALTDPHARSWLLSVAELFLAWRREFLAEESLRWLIPRGLWVAAVVCGILAFVRAPPGRAAVTRVAFVLSLADVGAAIGAALLLPRIAQ